MFQEELLNNVMERYSNELDEDIYRQITTIFVEEHLKLLREQDAHIKDQIATVERILKSLTEAA